MTQLPLQDAVDDRYDDMTTTSTSIVDLTDTRRSASLVATATESPTPPMNVSSVRPHFLKERSMTTHDRFGLGTMPPSTANHQSKASSFLTKLLESSRSMPSTYDGKLQALSNQPAGFVENGNPIGNENGRNRRPSGTSDEPIIPQRRRQSIIVSDAHVRKIVHQSTMPALHSTPRQPARRMSLVGSPSRQAEIESDEDVTEAELRAIPLGQLVQNLIIYKKRCRALLRILCEIQRRLNDAEIESSTGRSSHVELCHELVDEGILSGIVLVLREFRFDVALQVAAVALLSFLADVSDLYAYMMAELDVVLLVNKIVAVHVSQERLVMNGSSLIHTISESKLKPYVVKMYKARQIEQQKKRAASFVEAFTAERKHSKAREVEARLASSVSQDDTQQRQLFLSTSHFQRTTCTELGAPPVLTAHYNLKTSLPRSRSTLIPPLDKALLGSSELNIHFHEETHWIRPKTSPDMRQVSDKPSASKLAAVYLASPLFVESSPMGKRVNATRGTQSVNSCSQKTSKKKSESGSVIVKDTSDLSNENGAVSSRVDEIGVVPISQCETDLAPSEEIGCRIVEKGAVQTARQSDDDANYDDDEFFADDENGTDNNAGNSTVNANKDRLLPVGSDSDLIDLVDQSGTEFADSVGLGFGGPSCHDNVGEPSPIMTYQELVSAIDACGVSDTSTSPSMPATEVKTISEVVGILESCINYEDPFAISSVGVDSGVQAQPPTRAKPKRKPTSSRPTTPGLCVSSHIIVRPVSKRILDKTKKATRQHRMAQSTPPTTDTTSQPREDPETARVSAQIAAMLDEVRDQPEETSCVEDKNESDVLSANPAVGFLSSPAPVSTPTTSVTRIQALYARGLQYHKANELDAAVRCYEEGIHLQHKSGVQREFASLYINLGSARMAQQRPYDALVAFTQAERIQPSNMKAKFNCGLVLMQLAQWEEAAVKFEQVVAADPSHVRAQCALEQCQTAAIHARKS